MSEIPTLHSQDEIEDQQSIANVMHTWRPNLRTDAGRAIDGGSMPVDLTVQDAQSGRDINVGQGDHEREKIMLDRGEIRPRNIALGGTEVVLQRHGKYIRDKDNPDAGGLTQEAIQLETESAERYFSELIASIPESERNSISVLFVSSDTSYANSGRRSYQTTEVAQQVAEQLFQENGIHLLNILNISPSSINKGAPIPMRTLREPQMFDKSPDFISFMKEKYGDLDQSFWIAFEEDVEREARLEMGAEGPDEISDRMKAALRMLIQYSETFHSETPNSRLIIWAGTHYDTISPFVKRDVLHRDKSTPVLVDYGGGIVIDIDQSGQASTVVSDNEYKIDL